MPKDPGSALVRAAMDAAALLAASALPPAEQARLIAACASRKAEPAAGWPAERRRLLRGLARLQARLAVVPVPITPPAKEI